MRQTFRRYVWSDSVSSLSVSLEASAGTPTAVTWKAEVRHICDETREGVLGEWFDAVEAGRDAFIGMGGQLAVVDAQPTFKAALWEDETSMLSLTSVDQGGSTEWTTAHKAALLRTSFSGTSSGWGEAVGTARKATEYVADASRRLTAELYRQWKKKRVVEDRAIMGGAPTFRGSRLLVRKVGATLCAAGCNEEDLRADYPHLTDEDLIFARLFMEEGKDLNDGIAAFYTQIQDLLLAGSRSSALDHIYKVLDEALLACNFDLVRAILNAAGQPETVALQLSAYLSMLVVTAPWRRVLRNERHALAERIRPRILSEGDDEGVLMGTLERLLTDDAPSG